MHSPQYSGCDQVIDFACQTKIAVGAADVGLPCQEFEWIREIYSS